MFINVGKGTIYYRIKKYFRIYFCLTILNKCCIFGANKARSRVVL